jgi:hypothetical protein
MTNYSRRKFIKKSALAVPGLILLHDNVKITGFTTYKSMSGDVIKVLIPVPMQVVIDDVGWWSGEDGSKGQEPYRTGISRNHVPAAFRHCFGKSAGRDISLAEILLQHGVNYLKPYNDRPDMILEPDSVNFQHLLVHSQLTKIMVKGNHIYFDFTETDKLPRDLGKKTLAVKIQSARPLIFRSETLKINSVSPDRHEGFLYTIKAERMQGRIRARIYFEPDKPESALN